MSPSPVAARPWSATPVGRRGSATNPSLDSQAAPPYYAPAHAPAANPSLVQARSPARLPGSCASVCYPLAEHASSSTPSSSASSSSSSSSSGSTLMATTRAHASTTLFPWSGSPLPRVLPWSGFSRSTTTRFSPSNSSPSSSPCFTLITEMEDKEDCDRFGR